MVVENVIQVIAKENLKPGDKLPPESYFIQEYGVSRVTVREAFKKLSSMGAVTIRSGDGTFVNSIKLFEVKEALIPLMTINNSVIEDLYEARICIETFIVRLAVARRTEDDLIELMLLIENMKGCLNTHDIDNYSTYDNKYHNYLSKMCGNSVLQSIFDSLVAVRKSNIDKSNIIDKNLNISIQDHLDIYEAIKSMNADKAAEVMKQHLIRSKNHMLQSV